MITLQIEAFNIITNSSPDYHIEIERLKRKVMVRSPAPDFDSVGSFWDSGSGVCAHHWSCMGDMGGLYSPTPWSLASPGALYAAARFLG